jgi:hypothetical protein
MPDNSLSDDFELVARTLGRAQRAARNAGERGEDVARALGSLDAALAALDRIRAAWATESGGAAAAFPIYAPSNAIVDKYSTELEAGSVHVVFLAYPSKIASVFEAYELSRKQGRALHKLADALEQADEAALTSFNAQRGEPS